MSEILRMLGVSLGTLAVIYLPSLLMLRFLGIRGYLLGSIAPVWAAGVATAASLIFNPLGIFWNLQNYLIFNLVSIILCFLIGKILRMEQKNSGIPRGDYTPVALGKTAVIAATVLIAAGSLFYWLPTVWYIPVELPPQQNDSTFHLASLMTIVQSGDASPLTAFSSMYGLGNVKITYPAVWHQFAALFATEETVVLAAKSMQLTMAALWLINLNLLANVVLPRLWGAGLIAVSVAQIIPVFPVYYHVIIPLWPNAIGISMLPGMLAGLLTVFRNIKYRNREEKANFKTFFMQVSVVFLGVLGLTATYPTATFSFLALLSGGGIIAIFRVAKTDWDRKVKLGMLGGLLLFILGLGVFLTKSGSVNWLFGRPVDTEWDNLVFKAMALLTLSPSGGGGVVYKAWLILWGVASLIGVVLLWRNQYTKWISISWGFLLLLVIGSLVPLPGVTKLTALWYYGSYRLMPVLAILTIVTTTVTTAGLIRALAAAYKRITQKCLKAAGYKFLVVGLSFCIIVCSGALSWDMRVARARDLYKPLLGQNVFMADSEEMKMIFRTKNTLTEDKLLLGEASTGAALVYIVSGHPVAYKQVTFGSIENADRDSAYLAKYFERYQIDRRICEIVNRYNIGYFYVDRSQPFNSKDQKERAEGLFGVLLAPQDFKLIDRGGLAEIYRFTGCEPRE